jgi:MFS family permease
MFRRRNLSIASIAAMLWSAAMFAWFFLSALYMQLVLGFTPMQIGIAFIPANLIMAVCSLGLSARLVMRFGVRRPLGAGLLLASVGLALFARAPLHGTLVGDILPGMVLLGIGAGIGFNPMLMAAMSEASPTESGLASGIVNTAFLLGGALGLAVLASVAALHSASLAGANAGHLQALAGGYRTAFAASAGITAAAALLGGLGLRSAAATRALTESKPA